MLPRTKTNLFSMSIHVNSTHVIVTKNRAETFQQFKKNLLQYRHERKKNGKISDPTRSKIKNMLTNFGNAYEHERQRQNKKATQPNIGLAKCSYCRTSPSRSPLGHIAKLERLSFITVAFPVTLQSQDDKTLKRKYLNRFIQELKRLGANYYFWIAEVNISLHFHIISDNKQDQAENIITTWSRIVKCNEPRLADVRQVKNFNGLVEYLLKNDNTREIEGRLHGCSDNMKEFRTKKLSEAEEIEFQEVATPQLRITFSSDYHAVLKPTKKGQKILLRYFTNILRTQLKVYASVLQQKQVIDFPKSTDCN